MTVIPKVKITQPRVQQMHDSVDWVTAKVEGAQQLAREAGDKAMLELLNDIAFDVAQLREMLPPRQLELPF